ncbi:MAG TPA: hypothetical protein VKY85_18555 [Candidatus Angelobacter sp.]|nr:hypothetical protein [Candidatus Angelobacter sp.]
METLRGYEREEAGRFDQMQREREELDRDPDDVFIHARERRQEIRSQIRLLQEGLKRQRVHKKARGVKRGRKRRGQVTRHSGLSAGDRL